MNVSKYIFIVLLIAAVGQAYAQQIPVLNQYIYNPNLYNPARTGLESYGQVSVNHRQQWLSLPDFPISSVAAFEMPINKTNIGIGAQLYQDETHIINKFGGVINYAYHIPFGEKKTTKLSFGGGVGAFSQRFDFLSAVVANPNDEQILELAVNGIALDISVGANFRWKGLNLGFSVPQVIANQTRFLDNSQEEVSYQLSRHYLAMASYRFPIGEEKKISLEPVALVRAVKGLPAQWEANLIADWKNIVFGSVGYRSISVNAWSASLGFRVKQRYALSYSIEYGFEGNNNKSFGLTNEFMVSYRFGEQNGEIDAKFDKVNKDMNRIRMFNDSLALQVQKNKEDIAALQVQDSIHQSLIDNILNQYDISFALQQSNQREIDSLKAEMAKMMRAMDGLDAQSIEIRENPFKFRKMGTVFFDQASHVLSRAARSKLDALKANLDNKEGRAIIYLSGNASSEGNPQYNMVLTVRRTVATKLYLSSIGVDLDNIVMLPYGEENPDFPDQNSEANREKNRRVDIYVTIEQ